MKNLFSYKIRYCILTVLHWLCTIVGALVIIGFLTYFLRSCYYNHKPEAGLYGSWVKENSEDEYNGMLMFDWDGVYYNNDAAWHYQYIEPDSLILHPYVLYEERYKILKLTTDTLVMRLSESIFHAVDKGVEIEAPYGNGSKPLYIYVRKNNL